MGPRTNISLRKRAFRLVRRLTLTAAAATVSLTGAFSAAAAYSFTSATTPAAPVPKVPLEPAPEQSAPPSPIIDVQVVHHSGYAPGTYVPSGAGPRPPAAGPGAPPPPPPAPVCVSTPSKPCP